ncbi:uncharacterized protein RAG0_14893 [Rhynchosporium agropyri]|uniref:Uncharacterized protein n=1 Tax=Rhynchosporium agropyri TaxID=914238 RepID=A0A1E1LKR8_9HELO|nr:uncharacterized protein RAG0_14893 [Rhynchosporium agropyri]
MVLLTMTALMVEALRKIQGLVRVVETREEKSFLQDGSSTGNISDRQDAEKTKENSENGVGINAKPSPANMALPDQAQLKTEVAEPILWSPKIGNPISHGQVVELSQQMKAQKMQPFRLEDLLRGARIYVPPPAPKPEPTSEYKALMARLRREEEARSYHRMTNPPPPMETFSQRIPSNSGVRAFASSHQNINISDPNDDGITFADINRQTTLIFNVLVSIVACAVAIWIAAKWWSTPARLAMSMSGSALVGVAEVVVYSGYLRRVGEATEKEKEVKEVKEIVNTWVVGAGNETGEVVEEDSVIIKQKKDDNGVRERTWMKDVS